MTRSRWIVALAAVTVVVVLVVWRRGSGSQEEEEFATDVLVHVDEVTQTTLHRFVTAYGTVEARPAIDGAPAAGALITPVLDGVVTRVEAVEGRRVTRGAVLVRLDDRLARAAVERARAQVDLADSAFARQERLLASDGTSQRAYQEALQQRDAAQADLATAETELGYMALTSPLDGVVTRVAARPGQRVTAGTVLAQVVDPTRLVVAVAVPAGEIGGVAVGRPALLGTGADAPQGSVLAVGRDIEPATGTYRVLVSVASGSGLSPGEFLDVRIDAETHSDVLAVPEPSVVTRGDEGSWIMVVDGDRATRLMVTPGIRDDGLVEVEGEGVSAGMRVVTIEAYSLPEETRVRIASD